MSTEQDHSAVLHIFFHGSPQTSLSLSAELISLIDDQHFESFSTFSFNIAVTSDFLDDILNDVLVLVLVVGRSHLNVIVAGEDAELDCSRGSLRFQNTLLLFQLEYVLTEYLRKKGISSSLLACAFRSIHNDVLCERMYTGKSGVSASCLRALVS